MKPKLYVDMDGVLADFVGFFIEHEKVKSDKELTMERKIFYHIKHDLFLRLKPFPANEFLLKAAIGLFGEYHILSTPMDVQEEKCKEDKLLWICKHLLIKPKSIIFSENKSQYAEGNILIDDYRPNIDKWNSAGGFGIKYKARSKNYTVHDIIEKLIQIKFELDNYEEF